MPDYSFWELFGSRSAVQIATNVQAHALKTTDDIEKAALFQWVEDFQAALYVVARETAPKVDDHIRRFLESERKRPPTDKTRHLSDNIQSRVPKGLGPVGVVGVADESELDRTTNPDGGSDKPYWLVIEEGSAAIQPEMRGRRLFGSFHGPAGDSAPSQDHFREDSSFIFGSEGGQGMIDREIEPQHFLERGTEEGWRDYIAAIGALQDVYLKRLVEIRTAAGLRAAGIILR